jgi:outer membrane protein TolC
MEAEALYKLSVKQAKESLKNALQEAENALDRLAELNSIK